MTETHTYDNHRAYNLSNGGSPQLVTVLGRHTGYFGSRTCGGGRARTTVDLAACRVLVQLASTSHGNNMAVLAQHEYRINETNPVRSADRQASFTVSVRA
jgi:hypothetical protein